MAQVEGLIRGPLAKALKSGRARFNAKVAQARHSGALDLEAFADVLRSHAAPALEAAEKADPSKTEETAEALFDVCLMAVSKGLAGPRASRPGLISDWSRLIRRLPGRLVESPSRLAGAVFNGLWNVASQLGSEGVSSWVRRMADLGPKCPDVPACLELGMALAWRGGMAQYRRAALKACAKLPEPVALRTIGAPTGTKLAPALEKLSADPWFDPSADGKPGREIRITHVVGAFRGFGGQFIRPPTVDLHKGRFLAFDGEACFEVHADRFGAVLKRAHRDTLRSDGAPKSGLKLLKGGRVSKGSRSAVFADLADASSWASDGTTLLAAVPTSHSILVAAEADAGTEDG